MCGKICLHKFHNGTIKYSDTVWSGDTKSHQNVTNDQKQQQIYTINFFFMNLM